MPEAASPTPASHRISYGPSQHQFGDLTIPMGEGPHPVIAFIHGGFWRNSWDLSLAEPQASDSVERGFATWNIEYRRVGDRGGGFPGTLADVAAAIDHLAEIAPVHHLDIDRLAVVGHSAGGHLALWAGSRSRLTTGSPGAMPLVQPVAVVGQAPISDLVWASEAGLGGGAVGEMMGSTPDSDPEAWAVADPAVLLPPSVDQLIVHGTSDEPVPIEATRSYADRVEQSVAERADRPAGGAGLSVVVFDGADHFDVIDPSHESWKVLIERLISLLRSA